MKSWILGYLCFLNSKFCKKSRIAGTYHWFETSMKLKACEANDVCYCTSKENVPFTTKGWPENTDPRSMDPTTDPLKKGNKIRKLEILFTYVCLHTLLTWGYFDSVTLRKYFFLRPSLWRRMVWRMVEVLQNNAKLQMGLRTDKEHHR